MLSKASTSQSQDLPQGGKHVSGQTKNKSLAFAGPRGAQTQSVAVKDPKRVRPEILIMKGARWQSSYVRSTAIGDTFSMLAGASLAVNTRFFSPDYRPTSYLIITLALPLGWLLSIKWCGGYDQRLIGVGSDEFRRLMNAAFCLTAFIACASYSVKFDFARAYLAIALPAATILDLSFRYYLRKRLHRRRTKGYAMQRVLAIGHTDAVSHLISEMRRVPYHGLSIVGACLTDSREPILEISNVPVLGGIHDTLRAVNELEADTVAVLACPELSGAGLRELIWELEKYGTSVYMAPAVLAVGESRTTIRPIAGLPLLHLEHPQRTGARIAVKELFDRTAASVVLFLLWPVFLAVMLAIKADDGGPVFFKQVRVGRNGETFLVWKFRTMVVDAEQVKGRLVGQNEANGTLFKMRKDPRITRAGSWLRRHSLDELPQLINVARGEMSLVGPRPALPEETAKYDGTHMIRRIVVKPGITGLWQVSGRSDLSLEDSMRLDVHYVENWTLFLDMQILWKTIHAVLAGNGAYL